MELPPTDKPGKAQQKQREPKQTDLGEAGRGLRPGVIGALGQAVVRATARPFTSGQQSQLLEGKPKEGELGCPVLLQGIGASSEGSVASRVAPPSPQGQAEGRWPRGVGSSGCRAAGRLQKEESGTEGAEKPLGRLEGFPGRKDLQLG